MEEYTEADENNFGKIVAVTLKRMNPYPKLNAPKKINHLVFKIELSDIKRQQSYPMNTHFRCPINTSNNSNILVLNCLFQLAYMIVNHRDIQHLCNVLDIIFYKRRFLHSEQ